MHYVTGTLSESALDYIPLHREILSQLTSAQSTSVVSYLVFGIEPRATEFATFGDWFDEFTEDAREQFLQFYKEHVLINYGFVVTWYENYGQNGGFRFEIPPDPVASR